MQLEPPGEKTHGDQVYRGGVGEEHRDGHILRRKQRTLKNTQMETNTDRIN